MNLKNPPSAHKENPFRWADKVPCEWISALYAADRTIPDESLCDRVGWALYARCDSIIRVSETYETKVLSCPGCGRRIPLSDGIFTCPECGFSAAWEHFCTSYKGKSLYAANALPVFRRYQLEFSRAGTYGEKMCAIDTVIHSFHILLSYREAKASDDAVSSQTVWSPETESLSPRLGRSTGVNLLDGSLSEVLRFLDALSARPGTEDAYAVWKRALHRSNGMDERN